jgi:hypothetical protein
MSLTDQAYWARKWEGIETIGAFLRDKRHQSWESIRSSSRSSSGEALGDLCSVFDKIDGLKDEIAQGVASGELNRQQVHRELNYLLCRLADAAHYFQSATDQIEQQMSDALRFADGHENAR